MRWILGMVLVASALGWSGTVQADYEAGQRAWDAGRHSDALREWQASANAGDARAMLALGRLYMEGRGVPQNYIRAHMWFNLAASRGEAEAVIERDALTAHMAPEQVDKAQERAATWQPQDSKGTNGFSKCIGKNSSNNSVDLIICVGAALAPSSPNYFRIAGGVTEGIYTFSENTTTDADAGVSIVGALGFIFDDTPKLRSEIEVSYSLNPLNETTETNSPGTITDRATDGTLRQISTMLAVIYEIIPDCSITPYLKVGVGPTFLTVSDVTVDNRLLFKQQTKTFFAYQFGGGLKYTIIEGKLAVDVGYRNIDTFSDVTIETGSNRATIGVGNHTGLIGLTYLF